jgi:hypothetical protein
MQAAEISDVANANFQEIVEVAGHQIAVEHKGQGGDGVLEIGETVARGAVEHDADNGHGTAIHESGRNLGADRADEALPEQPLRAAMTGGRADIRLLGQLGIREPAVTLQQLQNPAIDAIERI